MTYTIEGLQAAVLKLQALEFPPTPEDEELGQLITQLSLMATRMLTAAGRAGRGEHVYPDQVPDTSELIVRLQRLHTVSEEDIESYAQAAEYLQALDAVRLALLGE